MIRKLIRAGIYVGSAALGLWVASLLLDGFELHVAGFLLAVLVFAGAHFLVSPLIEKSSQRQAALFAGGSGLLATFAALVIATLVADGLEISGITTWVLGTLVIWLVTSLAGWLLPMWLIKDESQAPPQA